MANKPTNPQLYSRVKAEAKKKFDRWPSAYGSAWLVKEYKRRGGGYRKAEDGMEVQGSVNQMMADLGMMANGGMMYGDYQFPFMDHSADAIYDYMMYNPEAQESEGEDMEEMRNGGIPQRYKNKGFTRVGAKRQSTRPGKKWMVLAKKGDKYKVVHGGYKGMSDFTKHRNQNRRDRFWTRMGGRNSAKAADPFSPLYWHKRFGTWAEGGEPQNEGFQALPEAVQAKIMANMMYGGDMYGMGGMPCYECGGATMKEGGTPFIAMAYFGDGGIKLDPAKKGTFKAQATRMGLSVQEAAKKILDAPEGKYSPEMRRKANFARNFAKQDGGSQLDFSAFENMEPVMEIPNDEKVRFIPGRSKNMYATEDFVAGLRGPKGGFNPFIAGNDGDESFRIQASDAKDYLKDRYADYSTFRKGFKSATNAVGDALSFAGWLGRGRKESQAQYDINNRFLTDNLYEPVPMGISGERGNFDAFGNFRPDETLASRTYYNQMGGEIEMTDDQIRQLVALGAEIEILD